MKWRRARVEAAIDIIGRRAGRAAAAEIERREGK